MLKKFRSYKIRPLPDPFTWYGIKYAGTQVAQWEQEHKGTRTIPAHFSFVLKVPLCNLRPCIINSVP